MEPLRQTADLVGRLAAEQPRLLVVVDGPDAAGKTVFADQLAGLLPEATRASVDDWLFPADTRYRRGELSADGYYEDAFDYQGLVSDLIDPFRHGSASLTLVRDGPATSVPADTVLIMDGVFLLRPQLARHWDLSIYLRISPEESLARALGRDADRFGSASAARTRYEQRYLPAQRRYLVEVDPETCADVVIDNTDLGAPRLLRWSDR
jgi:uridine kinase